jgi:hypothetical protein
MAGIMMSAIRGQGYYPSVKYYLKVTCFITLWN